MKEGSVYTFYSYKGGVGRTLAMANVGALLSQWGYRVLCIDWDLEAPGLHSYFEDWMVTRDTRGVVDLIIDFAEGKNPNWREYVEIVHVPHHIQPLSFMSAGNPDKNYAKRMQSINWIDLYTNNNLGQFIEDFRDDLKVSFDIILIDSRTGISDIGGVCTVHLPDILVTSFTANKQNLHGMIDVLNNIRDARHSLPFDRAELLVLPVATRYELRSEYRFAEKWLNKFAHALTPFYSEWLDKDVSPSSLLNLTKIPYIPYWNFGERLPVIEKGTEDPNDIGYSFETLAGLVASNLEMSELLVSNRTSFISQCQERGLTLSDLQPSPIEASNEFQESIKRWKAPLRDFIISYHKEDSDWAKWVSWQLEEEGYSTMMQSMDEVAHRNLLLTIRLAATAAQIVVQLLSRKYVESYDKKPEWEELFSEDFMSEEKSLLPIRIGGIGDLNDVLEGVYLDLVGAAVEESKNKLLSSVRAKYIRSRDTLSAEGSRSILDQPTFPGQIFHTPVAGNAYFTGREHILEHLHARFVKGETSQALYGLGGVGKTQTAFQYAYLYRNDYKMILWAKAHSRESLIRDYAQMAEILNLPTRNPQDQDATASDFIRWIEKNRDWLLVLDHVEDLEMARDFIPRSKFGHVLLTTRVRMTGEIATPNMLNPFSPPEGALFLLRRLNKIDLDANLVAAPVELRAQAEDLSVLLGGLPLALDQAAAYIDRMSISISEYIKLYGAERYTLLSSSASSNSDDHHKSVAVTFSLSFKKVMEENRAAADVLRLCAFLDANDIPEEIFKNGQGILGSTLTEMAASPIKFIEAIGASARYSLLQRNAETKTNSIHRLVQAVIKDEMSDNERRLWAERAVRAVSNAFPDVQYKTWPDCERLVQHARVLSDVIHEFDFDFPDAAKMLERAGSFLKDRGFYKHSESILRHSLKIYEKSLGTWDQDITPVISELADVRTSIGDYMEAEQLYQRCRTIREQTLGADHPDVAKVLNNIAIFYDKQGRFDEAETLYERCLEIYQNAGGPEREEYADALSNLAQLHQTRGFYGQAETLYKQALAIKERLVGVDHPDMPIILSNLADLYRNQERYDEAAELVGQSLEKIEKFFGPNHLRTTNALFNLADVYREQQEYLKAESLYHRALKVQMELLGPHHLSTATLLNNLGMLYDSMERYEEAETLYKQTLKIHEDWRNTHHPDYAVVLNNLAECCHTAGRLEEAAFFYQRALEVLQRALGADHPHVTIVRENFELLKEEFVNRRDDKIA